MAKLTQTQKALMPTEWYIKSTAIQEAFDRLQTSLQRIPTITELADATGIEYHTVRNHIKELTIPDLAGIHLLRTGKVINTLFTNAENGDIGASNILFKYVLPNNNISIDTSGANGVTNIQINYVSKTNEQIEQPE